MKNLTYLIKNNEGNLVRDVFVNISLPNKTFVLVSVMVNLNSISVDERLFTIRGIQDMQHLWTTAF